MGHVVWTDPAIDDLTQIMDNPYRAPAEAGPYRVPVTISDGEIQKLIEGTGTSSLVFCDVSDVHLYGRRNLRWLTGELAERAKNAGLEAVVFQAVLWWCFVFIPVWPLGVYFAIRCAKCDDPDGDADQYRGLLVAWDYNQIAFHYLVTLGCLVAFGVGVFAMLRLRLVV